MILCFLLVIISLDSYSYGWYVTFAVRLIKDPRTQRPKGFGFVKFASEIDAQNALKAMNGRVNTVFHLAFFSSDV